MFYKRLILRMTIDRETKEALPCDVLGIRGVQGEVEGWLGRKIPASAARCCSNPFDFRSTICAVDFR